MFIFACPVLDRHVFATAESFTGVETRGPWVTGNERAEQRVGDVRVDGMLISIDVDLTTNINEESPDRHQKKKQKKPTVDRNAIDMALRISS